jgi:NADH:ubiquinone oxidoreductase subunit 6 (subunit J)
MSGANIIFYLLAAMIIVSAIASVTTRQIFRSAIFLLFSLTGIAGIYFWLDYQFVAAVQIVVYVGGIVVLIIFPDTIVRGTIAEATGKAISLCRTGHTSRTCIGT